MASGCVSASAAVAGGIEHLQCRALGGFYHTNPGIGRTQQCQTRNVPGHQPRYVQFDGHDGLRSRRTLADAVAGMVKVARGKRVETQPARLFRQGPFRVIRNMIPLPKRIELAGVEVVIVYECRFGFLGISGVGLDPCIGRFTQIARQADQRKTVVPSDRDQRNHATGADMVRHDDAPPLARGGIAHAALVKSQSAVIGLGAKGCHAGYAQ